MTDATDPDDWLETRCSCGHQRSSHCLDDGCCTYAPGEFGGRCDAPGCGCAQFERQTAKETSR